MSGILGTVFFFSRCLQTPQVVDPRGTDYAGSAKCAGCHQSISETYAHTAHSLSTRIVDENTIAGSFSKDSNQLKINDSTLIRMEKRDSGLYQVLYVNNKAIVAHRFDLQLGAVKGQTFLFWQKNGFFQLPVSYIRDLHQWTGSPGYSSDQLNFNRPVVTTCFACHSSFASGDPHGISVASAKQINWVFNIDCERCHGPAAAHVEFQESHPQEKQSRYMVSFQSLDRKQKIDLCAVCHSGTKNLLLKPTFRFKMGDTLSNYMNVLYTDFPSPDEHGSQKQFFAQSKCFRMSGMDCTTCHNAHVNERGIVKSFNEHCQTCHTPGQYFCKLVTDSNIVFLQNNCTGCHMPAQSAKVIRVQSKNNILSLPTMAVNHRIAIYPDETEKVLKIKSHDQKIP